MKISMLTRSKMFFFMILLSLFFFTCLNEINATGAGAHNRRNSKKIIIKKILSDSCSDSRSHKCSPSGYIGSEMVKEI